MTVNEIVILEAPPNIAAAPINAYGPAAILASEKYGVS